jgi:hypothetical protein
VKTIPVSDVELAKEPLPLLGRQAVFEALLHAPIEQFSPGQDLVFCNGLHPLAAAAACAFYDHRPLVLSPDVVWFCLLQGLAHHLSLNAGAQGDRLVPRQGENALRVVRTDFVLGRQNPWPEAFAAFSDLIGVDLGRLRDLVVADFSTTGPNERAAFQVALMDAFHPYFEYTMNMGCGIPSIRLTGTPDDWRSVRRRASMLSELGLEWWTISLLPVLDQLVRSVEGEPERAFWQSFFRHENLSGTDELTGWIQTLFPYLVEFVPVAPLSEGNPRILLGSAEFETLGAKEFWRRNAEAALRAPRRPVKNPHLEWSIGLQLAEERQCESLSPKDRQGPTLDQLPSGTASASVLVTDLRDGSKQPLRFVAGLFGASQDALSGALAPEFGWAVVHEPSDPS